MRSEINFPPLFVTSNLSYDMDLSDSNNLSSPPWNNIMRIGTPSLAPTTALSATTLVNSMQAALAAYNGTSIPPNDETIVTTLLKDITKASTMATPPDFGQNLQSLFGPL